MEAITEATANTEDSLTDEDIILSSVDIPGHGEFIACTECGHRSYHFFIFGEEPVRLLPYCHHHGQKNEKALVEGYKAFHVDYSEDLLN